MSQQIKEKIPSAIILAAGKSERMGMPKFALKFNAQKTFIEEIVDRFTAFGCHEIVVVMNDYGARLIEKSKIKFPDNTVIAINPNPEQGRFLSIKTGLGFLKDANLVFLHNADNPFISSNVLKLLFNDESKASYFVPVHNNRGGHPILLTREVINEIQECPIDNTILKEYLQTYKKATVEVNEPEILININTIEDYQKANGLLKQHYL